MASDIWIQSRNRELIKFRICKFRIINELFLDLVQTKFEDFLKGQCHENCFQTETE